MAAVAVDRASQRRTHRNRRDRRRRDHDADLHLAGTEVVQEAGQVQEEIERERLREVRERAQ